MIYPFRFNIGDAVICVAGHYKDHTGIIHTLELRKDKTVAVVKPSDGSGKLFAEAECNLRGV